MDKLEKMSDEQLVKLYASGNNRAFEFLLLRYKNLIYTHIYSYVKDQDISDDIFQETFIKVITCIRQDNYTESGKFRFWVMRIAHNLVIDYLRVIKSSNTVLADNEDYSLFNNANLSDKNIEDNFIENQTIKEIHALIETLPKLQREIIIMRFFKNMTFKEISEKSGVSINTSLGRMRYALLNMRKIAQEKHLSFSL
ncbi:MAG: sigma-70 family RNA polymerase sigma factor [Bacteroidia bacterium]|nr:sigma-70 family RNA polymerase sigma factor [Bacteroidia bacterium]